MTSIISGLWDGFFEYGPDYEWAGERVHFRPMLNETTYASFKGTCLELSGPGMREDPAIIAGFCEGDFISFIKEYSGEPMDIEGNKLSGVNVLSYEGNYNWHTKIYTGFWDIVTDINVPGTEEYYRAGSGKWQMKRV